MTGLEQNQSAMIKDEFGATKVIGIAGAAYCGSTILNLVLDSHSQVFGGGEMHWLLRRSLSQEPFPPCRHCGPGCVHWQAVEPFGDDLVNAYRQVSCVFDRPVVADISKSLAWMRRLEREGLDISVTMLVKHPLRHIASIATNDANQSKLLSRKLLRNPRAAWSSDWRRADYALDHLWLFYRDILADFDSMHRALDTMFRNFAGILQYERFVAKPRAALEPVLASVDLQYEEAMLDYASRPHHCVGGNWGPVLGLVGSREATAKTKNAPSYRLDYYRDSSNLRIDNKFVQAFGPALSARLLRDERLIELSAVLGYADATYPFPVEDVL